MLFLLERNQRRADNDFLRSHERYPRTCNLFDRPTASIQPLENLSNFHCRIQIIMPTNNSSEPNQLPRKFTVVAYFLNTMIPINKHCITRLKIISR